MNFLKRAVHLIFQNFGWKVLSLVIAVAIWALVATEPELSTFATVRLEYKNLPDDLEISSEPVTSLALELRGPSGELRMLGNGGLRPAVVLDMSSVQPGERTFTIGDGNVQLSRGVHLVRAIPSQVRLDFEPRLIRTIPVVPRFTGEGENGYSIAHWQVTPANLEIVGPASHVRNIHQASTDAINIARVFGSSQFQVNAFVNDPYVRFQSSPQVNVSVTVVKK